MPLCIGTGNGQAFTDMVVYECFFGRTDGTFDCLQLLRDLYTRAILLQHGDNGAKVAAGTLEALYDR